MWWTSHLLKKAMVFLAFDGSRWLWFREFGRQFFGFESAYTRNDDDDRIPPKKERRHRRDERFWDTRVLILQLHGQPFTPMAWSASASFLAVRSEKEGSVEKGRLTGFHDCYGLRRHVLDGHDNVLC